MTGTLSKLRMLGSALLGAVIPLSLMSNAEAHKVELPAQTDKPAASASVKPSMSGQTLRQARNRLLDLWVKDRTFNAGMRQAPVQTLEKMGIKLSEIDRTRLVKMNWSASDDDLLKATREFWPPPGDSG
jgi:hypothetical protein